MTTTVGLDFVTYAADNYAHWIEYWLMSASRSNPDSQLFVYDVSTKPSLAIAQLAASFSNAHVIHWPPASWQSPSWIDELDFHFFWPGFNLRDEIKSLSRRLRYRITGHKKHDWMIDKQEFVATKKLFIQFSCVKPYIIQDAMTRGSRPLAFVDADAVILNHFYGHPVPETDVAVTVVDPDQVRIGGMWEPPGPDGPLPVSVINAGVIFFNKTPGAERLLDAWIDEISRVRHGSGDQTALANLLYRNDPKFHETMTPFRINTGGNHVLVSALPCARFNQVRINQQNDFIMNADVSIAHFVGSWKQPQLWQRVDEIIRHSLAQRSMVIPPKNHRDQK